MHEIVPGESEYDVCLSFAGQQREYVTQVAQALRVLGVRLFYDADERVSLWGKDLHAHLTWVYRDAARFCVLFLSRDYASRYWTTVEYKSAQARAFRENREYILPARFDDTEIAELNDVAFIDLRTLAPEKFAQEILEKLRQHDSQRVDPLALLRPLASQGLTVTTIDGTRGIGRAVTARRPQFALGTSVRIAVDLPRMYYMSFLNVEHVTLARRSYLLLDPLLDLTQPLRAGVHVLPPLPVGEPSGLNCLVALGRDTPFAWGGDVAEAQVAGEAQALARLAEAQRFVALLDYDVL